MRWFWRRHARKPGGVTGAVDSMNEVKGSGYVASEEGLTGDAERARETAAVALSIGGNVKLLA